MKVLDYVKVITRHNVDKKKAKMVQDLLNYKIEEYFGKGLPQITKIVKNWNVKRKCIKCGKYYNPEDFGPRKSRCKYCLRKYFKQYRLLKKAYANDDMKEVRRIHISKDYQ